MMHVKISTGLFLFASLGCTTSAKYTEQGATEPVAPSATEGSADDKHAGKSIAMKHGQNVGKQGQEQAGAEPAATPDGPVVDPGSCQAFSNNPEHMPEPPVTVPGKPIVVTRFMKTCTSASGQQGFDRESPWLAMGFPCTGGQGKVDVKGNYNNPKMVSFILGTDCAMSPPSREAAQALIGQALPIPPKARLAAYTPFVLQFWEVVGMQDADVGFSIDLRSAPAVEGVWKRVRENGSLKVILFGRENAWIAGDNFYSADGEIHLTGRNSFRLDVSNVKTLAKDDVEKVKVRCESLRPARNCAAVFQ